MTMALAPRHHALGAAAAARRLAPTGELAEYRPAGSRNYVRVGDVVHVRPSRPGRHDGFDSKVLRIRGNQSAGVAGVDVVNPATGGVHTVTPDRIGRRRQPKGGASCR